MMQNACRAGRLPEALAVLAWLVSGLGCETREGLARREGERARGEIAAQCGREADRERAMACVGERCEALCAGNGTGTVHRACVDACVGMGECATDADCTAGTRCVAVAPRVRRCGVDEREPVDGGVRP